MSQSDTINWSRMSLEELQHYWNAYIEPDLARDGLDLSTRPTYEEISESGYSGIAYALREHHELTLSQFLATVGYPEPNSENSYTWGIDDETTTQELELYLTTYLRRKGTSEQTVASKRSRLARYVRTYADHYDSADIVVRVREDTVVRRDERQRVRGVFDSFDVDLSSAESKHKHLTDVVSFYAWLEGDRDAKYNPALGAPHDYRWKNETPDAEERNPSALEAHHVRALADACESLSDRLLVVATCGWGLRRGEVAALSTSQTEIDDGDPRIVFGNERKNGPGTVTIHYGLETLEDRWLQLDERDSWNGHLFPSTRAASGHVAPDTITSRFKRLAERADVTVRGEVPTPQYGRRFWYRAYLEAVQRLSKEVSAIASEQGSKDASVVVSNYLGEEEARRRRREFMKEQLADAFER
ncbi:tyrosine-type recombinase/integrase [Natronosalvus rutilus]|uniref:Tyrosine-type recombinase/integrase n=1 Tax=Natronosalvus rutilus TaxID=2953753 RepID=A0A9E7NCF6_9EURY|nr:tyrosine-type recombinase/integrase [Natronosalvus rutilus]UTF55889.1 tyrosine-type recombinase/integrase [Natronosalvus rutilus]